jgi:hypothetical protein
MGRMKTSGPSMNPSGMDEHCDISVRKIDNGYVVRESRCCGGVYSSSECYSPTKPDLAMMGPRGPNAGEESLRGAMKELKK